MEGQEAASVSAGEPQERTQFNRNGRENVVTNTAGAVLPVWQTLERVSEI